MRRQRFYLGLGLYPLTCNASIYDADFLLSKAKVAEHIVFKHRVSISERPIPIFTEPIFDRHRFGKEPISTDICTLNYVDCRYIVGTIIGKLLSLHFITFAHLLDQKHMWNVWVGPFGFF